MNRLIRNHGRGTFNLTRNSPPPAPVRPLAFELFQALEYTCGAHAFLPGIGRLRRPPFWGEPGATRGVLVLGIFRLTAFRCL